MTYHQDTQYAKTTAEKTQSRREGKMYRAKSKADGKVMADKVQLSVMGPGMTSACNKIYLPFN